MNVSSINPKLIAPNTLSRDAQQKYRQDLFGASMTLPLNRFKKEDTARINIHQQNIDKATP